ncbi:MAG: N-acetylglucosamine-6-phosphate deacetylase [Gammaproteobacteria bacterium]|nr:N-acetylglucosamine-6-phosphate deacetylase [Gammaproteobacteria bacterium]
MSGTAFVNGALLVAGGFATGKVLLIEDGRISAVLPAGDAPLRGVELVDLAGRLLLPGFIDVQVNGGGGVLFNDVPTIDGIRRIAHAHARFGTTGFLPTLISDDLAVVASAIAAVDAAIVAGVPGVLGIHIEGPYLNERRKGVHNAEHFLELDRDAVALLCSLRRGVTLLTLAPEHARPEALDQLAAAGVILSAGHTNASATEIETARRHGLRGYTHLFNAMSQLTAREPGTVGAALGDDESYCGLIVDGRHVDPRVLRIALRARRHDRFMLVTDAMPPVGTGDATFLLQGRTITVADGYCVDEQGTLAGTALDMSMAVRNAIAMLALPPAEAVQMASENPARFLGLGASHGRLAVGCRADLLVADARYNIEATWIGGRRLDY